MIPRRPGLTIIVWVACALGFGEAGRPMVLVVLAVCLASGTSSSLTVREELRAGIQELYSGDTERARARFERLASAEPSRPEGPLFLGFTRWFSVEEDPFNTALRREFQAKLEVAQKLARAGCERSSSSEEARAEACLALGLAHGGLARLQAFEGATFKAAADARAAKRVLERVRDLRPEDGNALFGIGLYNYYAARLPRFLRVLRFMLLLPGGNREQGLAQLEKARREADLLAPEASLQLHDIYKFYEKDYARALEAIEDLERLYPENPRYYFLRILLEGHFMGRGEAALADCERVLDAASRGGEGFGEAEALWARYLQATVRFRMGQREAALEQLQALAGSSGRSRSPLWAPTVALTMALAADLAGRPSEDLFRDAAGKIGRRENLRFLETHVRSVLPPEVFKAFQAFQKHFSDYLQDSGKNSCR